MLVNTNDFSLRDFFLKFSYFEIFAIVYFLALLGFFSFFQQLLNFPVSAVVYTVLYLISLFYCFVFWRGLNFSRFLFFVLIVLSGVVISSLVSYSPMSSVRNVFVIFLNFIFAFLLADRLEVKRVVHIFYVSLVLMLIFSFAFGFLDHSLVIYNDPIDRSYFMGVPNIKGLFPHKIHAGLFFSIGAYLSYYYFLFFRSSRFISLYFLFLFFIFSLLVVLAGSGLGVVVYFTVFIAMILYNLFYKNFGFFGVVWILLFVTWFCVVVYAYDLNYLILKSLGRDPGLTGRSFIWSFGRSYIESHPFFGGGLGVFFSEDANSPAQSLWRQMRYYSAPSFHHGYIQLFAETGMVGGIGVLIALIYAFLKSFRVQYIVVLPVFIAMVIANLGASLYFLSSSVLMVFIMFVLLHNKPE